MLNYFSDVVAGLVSATQFDNEQVHLSFSDGTTRFATDAEVLAAAQAAKRTAIKQAARQVILARYPEWKQTNLLARAVELVSLGELSGPEWQQMQAGWAWIQAVRTRSDLLEADVAACTTVDAVENIVIGGWPE